MASMGEGQPANDERLDFIQDYTLKSLRLKPDKWARLMISDEQRMFLGRFVETSSLQVIKQLQMCIQCLKSVFTFYTIHT